MRVCLALKVRIRGDGGKCAIEDGVRMSMMADPFSSVDTVVNIPLSDSGFFVQVIFQPLLI